ncbi:GNAT family N-acetyltransferase [Arachnia propionica]|uniref:GNAT family N-acetyltransferase n=1 Tax=Arachnia propionica TaxID=1750 RepID=UPI0030D10D83
MTGLEIREFALPGIVNEEWAAYCRMNTDDSVEVLGPQGPQNTPEVDLKAAHAALTERRVRRWLVWFENRPVGFARLVVNFVDEPEGAMAHIYVTPGCRRQGIGQALAEVVHSALEPGIRYVNLEVPTPVPGPDDETLPSPVGEGALLASSPRARFALRYGFVLGQVMWYSRYNFAAPVVSLSDVLVTARAVAGPDYEVCCLEGEVPPRWATGVAVLKQSMSTDAPSGGLIIPETSWDADRVHAEYARFSSTNRLFLGIVVHEPTGKVVALNELSASREWPDAMIHQWDTIVLPEHRGHRLGTLVKAANLEAAHAALPQAPAVHTFNAAENHHMLAVNEMLGFRRCAALGMFQAVREPVESAAQRGQA